MPNYSTHKRASFSEDEDNEEESTQGSDSMPYTTDADSDSEYVPPPRAPPRWAASTTTKNNTAKQRRRPRRPTATTTMDATKKKKRTLPPEPLLDRPHSKRPRRARDPPYRILAYRPPPFKPTNLGELIRLAKLIPHTNNSFRDCGRLRALLAPLTQLYEMIGMTTVKQKITSLVLKELQAEDLATSALKHIKLEGPPGVGKTVLCSLLATILAACGRVAGAKVVHGSRTNMISSFLGDTGKMTEKVIRSAFGGVLLIDEITSMSDGRGENNGDSFSKDCLDTLNKLLESHATEFVCVVAGYADEIERDFFSVNQGLRSRFTTTLTLTAYSADELYHIFVKKITDLGYHLLQPLNPQRFEESGLFPTHGRSVQVLVDKIIEAHSVYTFGESDKHLVSSLSVEQGFADHRAECARNVVFAH
jgi:AAA+ superfamily predicted ATPase